jgi:pimeloyl-ACP methyl ester carboxylesterase
METIEGKILLESGHAAWYRRMGAGERLPLLVLHGGPGAGHDYLEPLEKMGEERPVIFYDQLGCGNSDQPDDRSLWCLDRFVQEIDEVRRALELARRSFPMSRQGVADVKPVGFVAHENVVRRLAPGIIVQCTKRSYRNFSLRIDPWQA